MKKKILFILFCSILSLNFLFSQQDFQGIGGITMDNYPRIDGSTSTNPLNIIIAARLLNFGYYWTDGTGGRDVYFTNQSELPWSFRGKLLCSQTHNAIINLMKNQTDLIIVARKISADEQHFADSVGVTLIQTPIALDALDFIVNTQNIVNSLTVSQIQNIYLGNITNWSEVGGANEAIIPFIRNANSGSQEMMNEFVMGSLGMQDWTVSLSDAENTTLWDMFAVYEELVSHPNGICFTPHYYKEFMMRNIFTGDVIKTIAVDGILANAISIKNETYPFVAPVYVMIRSDVDLNSMTYKLYEWLQTKSGKDVINESGYVPYGEYENNIEQINNPYIQISPNPTEGIIEIKGINSYSNLTYKIYNSTGQIIQNGNLKQTIDLSNSKGINILTIMQNQKIIAQEKIIVK